MQQWARCGILRRPAAALEGRHKCRGPADSQHLRRSPGTRWLLPLLCLIVVLAARPGGGRPAFAGAGAGGGGGRGGRRGVSQKALPRLGEDVYGKVSGHTNSGLLVSVEGLDVTAFVHISQLSEKNDVKHPSEVHQVGDTVKGRVVSNSPSLFELSIVKARRKRVRDFIVGQEVTGNVTVVRADGAFVDVGAEGEAFVHISQVQDGKFIRDVRDYLQVGQIVDARVRRRDDDKGQLELSMLPAYKVSMPLLSGLKVSDLQPGQEMGGVVTGVRKFGCFVDVGADSDGLVHIRNLNGGMVDKIDTIVKIGDGLVVRVLRIGGGKLELELAAPLPRLPAVDAFLKVPEDEWLEGVVESTPFFGALVELTPPAGGPKVTAFLRKTEIDDPGDMYPGNKIKVRLDKVDVGMKQIFVSQMERKEIPRLLTFDELLVGDELEGVVTDVRKYGAFVDVRVEGKIGLLPIQKMNGGIVPDIHKIVQTGDKLRCRVTSFRQGKLELGLVHALPRVPSVEPFVPLKNKWVTGTVAGRGPSGTYISLTPPGGGRPVIALMFGKTSNLNKGEEVPVVIFSVDTEMKQVFVSDQDKTGEASEENASEEKASEEDASVKDGVSSGRAQRAAMFGLGE